ncbi:hypothetical protein [Blastococcus montanus]|uniref:alpha/beta hydrolase family protein n=1 Tax=Blastococcus montanus TaxID=3144973 RepID=UPI003209BB27
MPFQPRRTMTLVAAVAAASTLTGVGAAQAEPVSSPPPGGTPCLEGAPAEPTCISGTLADGTPYQFVVPSDWNGTVVVALDFAPSGERQALTQRLLDDGVARGGTTRDVTGWDIRGAIDNQAEALARFEEAYGPARHAIASGNSMGGFVAAGTAQVHPDVFDAAVPFCGGLGGSVAQWNQKLDTVFVLERLIAPGLPVIDIPEDIEAARRLWFDALGEAQQTPEGRARIALAAAIGQVPAWGALPDRTPTPRPGDRDVEALQEGAYLALAGGPLPYMGQAMSSRRAIMEVVGGNPSWNTGVDYEDQLRSADPALRRAVRELYREADLDLRADLGTLADAPRVAADPAAVERFAEGIVFDGDPEILVLNVSNIGDQISTVAQDGYYADTVRRSGANPLFRQVWVESVGHCAFSLGEQEAALQTMFDRLESGHWPSTNPRSLNERARALDSAGPARFITYDPPRFNRPYGG